MREIPFPPFWHDMSPSTKASWLSDNHYARNYSEACGLLNKLRHKKTTRREIAVPALSVPSEQVVAEQERKHLW